MSRLLNQKKVVLARRPVRVWDISPTSASGDDAETQYSEFFTIPDPKPVGEGYFGVPGMSLSLDEGGSLQSYIEFWGPTVADPETDEKISEAAIGSLSVSPETVNITEHALPDLTVSGTLNTPGTYYSSWSSAGSIAAGSGFIVGDGSFGSDGTSLCNSAPYAIFADFDCESSLTLELGNAASTVVGSVPLFSYTGSGIWNIATYAIDHNMTGSSGNCHAITWTDTVTKARLKLVCTTATNHQPGWRIDDCALWSIS